MAIQASTAPRTESGNEPPMSHDWIPSTLGHGETVCRRCFMTNREAAALGKLNLCPQESSS